MINVARILAAALALALVAAACSNDDDDTATDGEQTTVAAASDDATTDEGSDEAAAKPSLSITNVSFASSTVTIRNDGDAEVSLDGMFMCNRPAYAGLPAETLAPGATLDIDVTELDLRGSGGEFGLYTGSDFGSAAAMVDYVQWGGPGNGRASVAVEAGIIAEGEFVDNGEADFTVG